MPYRLIVSDMDDTLLDEKGLLSKATVDAIGAARQAGAELVLASGRMPCAMRETARELKVTMPMIAYNGAQLVDPRSEEIIYSLSVPVDVSRELMAYCEEMNLHVQAYEGEYFLTAEDNEPARSYRDALHGKAKMKVTGEPLSRCVDWPQPKMLAITSPEQAPEYLAKLRARFEGRVICAISKPRYIECTSPAAGKGRALEELCRQLGVPADEVVAFGDGQNDVDMLRFAGLGCAVANAREEVRAQADLVAPSNREDGVARVITRLLDEGKLGKGA